ncbi:MAG: anti-sigma factor [Pseudorhodoplanes sp.]|uniref:anti-sigma factor n=1 Tax=Pseudorhodoplanes sp. TaxID=1934341 RepID=UPI003D103374
MADMSMDEDREILAAEYALGTLDASERSQAERLVAADPEFAAHVAYWERRLSLLAEAVEPVEPPASVWNRIAAALPGASLLPGVPSGNAEIVDLGRRLKRWRTATYVAGALAASLLLFIGVREATLPKPDSGRYVAVLQADKVSPGFLLSVDLKTKEFTVRRVGADPQRDRSFELWLVHDKFPQPRSLGVIGDHEFTRAQLSAYDRQIINEATYAVTVEPPGGSPTGVATGPIVYVGKLIEAVP